MADKKRERNQSKNATIQEWKTAILRVVASKNADGTDTYPSCVDGFKLWLACTKWEDMLCAVPDLVKEGCITQTPLAMKLKQFYNVHATNMVSKNQMTPKFHNGQLSLAKRVVCDAHELVTHVPKKRKSGVQVSVDGEDQAGRKRKRSKKGPVVPHPDTIVLTSECDSVSSSSEGVGIRTFMDTDSALGDGAPSDDEAGSGNESGSDDEAGDNADSDSDDESDDGHPVVRIRYNHSGGGVFSGVLDT